MPDTGMQSPRQPALLLSGMSYWRVPGWSCKAVAKKFALSWEFSASRGLLRLLAAHAQACRAVRTLLIRTTGSKARHVERGCCHVTDTDYRNSARNGCRAFESRIRGERARPSGDHTRTVRRRRPCSRNGTAGAAPSAGIRPPRRSGGWVGRLDVRIRLRLADVPPDAHGARLRTRMSARC